MATGSADPTRGILDQPQARRAFDLDRHPPGSALTPWIDAYWQVAWDLAPGTVHRQMNLSHACLNLAVETDGAWVYGVPGPTFVRELSGQGWAFGVIFHPGAFYPWAPRRLADLFDLRVPLAEFWGEEAEAWAVAVTAAPDFAARAAVSDQWLARRLPALPGEGYRCARLLLADPELIRVEDACRVAGHDIRSLQRLFAKEVGAAPKEVLRRYRLMDAADRLTNDPDLTGADLAAALGYSDQAHFIRDFKAVTGVPPEAYRRRQSR